MPEFIPEVTGLVKLRGICGTGGAASLTVKRREVDFRRKDPVMRPTYSDIGRRREGERDVARLASETSEAASSGMEKPPVLSGLTAGEREVESSDRARAMEGRVG